MNQELEPRGRNSGYCAARWTGSVWALMLVLVFAPFSRGTGHFPLSFDPAIPFDAKELDRLVSVVEGDDEAETRPLVEAIMQVTAQKDARFKELIGRKGLRKRKLVDLALSGYDYAISGNKKALDRLMTADAAQKLGGDYMTIAMMGMLDEWDRTIEAVCRHKAHSGGTAGLTVATFFTDRVALFPESFAKFSETISTEQKVVERLASTVADDPQMDHDHGTFYRVWGLEDHQNKIPGYHDSVGFCVKELPREGAEPLILVSLRRDWKKESLDKKRNFVLKPVETKEGGKRAWKDVTDQVLPDKSYQSNWMGGRRKGNVVETAVYKPEFRRGPDLVWEDGKFIVREADGEKTTRRSRDPYSPSR